MVKKKKATITLYKIDTNRKLSLFLANELKAGFPSPAGDYIAKPIDLNDLIIKNPSSTFIGFIDGDSMQDVRIYDKDIVVIDRARSPRFLTPETRNLDKKDKVVCCLNGEFTIKFLRVDKENNVGWLVPANPVYPEIKITEHDDFYIWGTVIATITKH